MPIGNPSCRRCHGTGEIERIIRYTEKGQSTVSYEWEPCPCFRSQWVDEEDWTNDQHQRTAS